MLDSQNCCCCVAEEKGNAPSCFGLIRYDITVLSFLYCRMISIIRLMIMSAWCWSNRARSTVTSLLTFHYCPLATSFSYPPGPVGIFLCVLFFVRTSFKTAWWSPLGHTVQALWNVIWLNVSNSRTLFRTYWSSALRVNPSGSTPYPTTGGGRWDEVQSNRECWLLSDVCRDKI